MDPTIFATPAEFRRWLKANHDQAKELWVGYYKKATGLPSMTWPESVGEALCFGWIDGLRKKVDEKVYMIRFTPRRPRSNWSAVNIQMVKELKEAGQMEVAGLEAFERRTEEDSKLYSYEQNSIEFEQDFGGEFRKNEKAWEFFQGLPPSAKKLSIWWVISAKQQATKIRRLGILIECSEQGLRIPMLRRGKKG